MRTIVFIALQLSQPRCIKRIQAVYDAGLPIMVYGFDSGLYNDSLKSLPFPVTEIIKRTKEDSKLKKIVFFRNTVSRILKENRKDDLYYVFGHELGLFVRFLKCRNYVYEEADVTAARIRNSYYRNLMLRADRSIIKHSLLTVFTSSGFIKYLYPNEDAPVDKIVLMPNKLSPYFKDKTMLTVDGRPFDADRIRFGFIGLIRYPNTIIRFAKVVGRVFPQHEFHFYGDVEKQSFIDDEVQSYSNVFFHGRFRNPEDLQAIYKEIDISVVCYDVRSGNVRIAEPNKIYESIFFETPLVVSKGTFLSERVRELGIGYEIDASDDGEIERFIKGLNESEFEVKRNQLKSIPKDEVIDDSSELIKRLGILMK